jgi:hypothetical protein
MRRSIAARLVAMFALAALVTLSLVGAAPHGVLERELTRHHDDDLNTHLRNLSYSIERTGDTDRWGRVQTKMDTLTPADGQVRFRVMRDDPRFQYGKGLDQFEQMNQAADGHGGITPPMHRQTFRTLSQRIGPLGARKVVTLQTLPGDAGSLEGDAGKVGGFSLHAGLAAEAHESQQLGWGLVDFIAKLAALVPPPRAHLTRFHGMFAPNAALRARLTPSGRGKQPATDAAPVDVSANDEPRSPEERRRGMRWAQRLKRVFGIDVSTCIHCSGVRIVASIEDAYRHPRHPGSLREARCAGESTRPASSARPTGGGGVISRRPRRLSQAQSKGRGQNGHPI